jgi:hypothetical protein
VGAAGVQLPVHLVPIKVDRKTAALKCGGLQMARRMTASSNPSAAVHGAAEPAHQLAKSLQTVDFVSKRPNRMESPKLKPPTRSDALPP